MEKILKLYTYVDGGVNDTPFPNTETQVEIGEFRYDAKRMGGVPTITASVLYPSCLDDVWTDKVYAEFNGEKYFLKQTPTSSYSNEDARYRHDLELMSERVILDNVYFYDAVAQGETPTDDKPVSNGTKFVFWGNIEQFKDRLNASLRYSGIGYTAVVDQGVTSEEKLVSFEDAFFSNAIQESYNTFDIPYYFVGKTIHFGYSKDVIEDVFEYGVDNALVSITKNNANYKTVNRVTGVGSSDNIPFYYPNNSPKGDIAATPNRDGLVVRVLDYEKFSNAMGLDESIVYEAPIYENAVLSRYGQAYESGTKIQEGFMYSHKSTFTFTFEAEAAGVIPIDVSCNIEALKKVAGGYNPHPDNWENIDLSNIETRFTIRANKANDTTTLIAKNEVAGSFNIPVYSAGLWGVEIDVMFVPSGSYSQIPIYIEYSFALSEEEEIEPKWLYNGKKIEPKDFGLDINESTIVSGDRITQTLVKYVKTSQVLMPSIYRETEAAERFYNATNDTYEGVEFANPYTEGHPKEHIITVEDLKPTIKETMVDGLRIDMFSEFAYDRDDNDETYEDEEGNVYYKHPYFFGKLRRMDFNLFDHAIEQQPMVISFTSGNAGACSFEIGVTEEYPQMNPVQVDKDGNLIYDANGMVLCGCEGTSQVITEYQDSQQDTLNNEVWIALRKEEETYGILMPIEAHRPKACTSGKNDGDTFVILGINLPKAYIINAEKKLEAEIIRYMQENNEEKFNFNISFSRIYFEENPDILQHLNENARINIKYNNKEYLLYVNSFSYQMSNGNILPQITVELNEALTISRNALQNAINQVKSEVGRAISSIDVLGLATPYFLRKDADDEANGRINFKKGIKFGEGGKVEVLDNNSAKLTIEYLEVTKKATFTSLEIQEKTHVGGQILVTPAALNCGEVEEFEDHYRCYFQTKGEDGDEIFNQFAIGDQAVCQTFNAWGSKYYWRLVVGVGEDYIDLSKTDCDEESSVPSEGDKIIQLGNRNDELRQNAIVIAAYGDGSPYIIQYKGINSFELTDDNIVTMLSSTKNVFTGIVAMQAGSTGLSELQEYIDLSDLVGNADENAKKAAEDAESAKKDAENAKKDAEEAKDAIDNLSVGGQNLLRNSGFTGDYLTRMIDDEVVLDAADSMTNDEFVHWEKTNAEAQDSTTSASGKEVVLTGGSLSQTLYQPTIAGESYVLTFKAKGVTLTYAIGGETKTIALTEEWVKYAEKLSLAEAGSTFAISNAMCTICELQLERGTTATSWGNSPWDNSSDAARWQALKYLNQAIEEGTTVTQGGLILSSVINLGKWEADANGKTKLTSVLAGMSGISTEATADPAFWAGGNLTEATATVAKYLNYPTTIREGELPFVVTHGGRIIANDAIIRGTIYAENGEFTGTINANGGSIGLLEIYVNPYTKETTVHSSNDCHLGFNNSTSFTNDAFYAYSTYNEYEGLCQSGYSTKLNGMGFRSYRPIKRDVLEDGIYSADIQIEHDRLHFDGREVAINVNSGVFAGLRTKSRVIPESSPICDLDEFDYNILFVKSSGSIMVYLPINPCDGQEYILETKGQSLTFSSEKPIYNHISPNDDAEVTQRGVYRLKYYADASTWTLCCISVL